MTIKTYEPTQVLEFQRHLDAAAGMEQEVVASLRVLAAQLATGPVMPLIGAGGSFDCGMPLARKLGEDLLRDYLAEPSFEPRVENLSPDLGDVAEAIYSSGGQEAVVEALGLPDPALWPPASGITEHFCGYRVLARLAREGLFEQAMTLNYDCGYEAGLRGEGFLLARGAFPGRVWNDHATLIADPEANNLVVDRGSLVLRKLHGCAERYREEKTLDPSGHPEDRIVVRRIQLANWRNDLWARDQLRVAARESVLLLLGFSGQDPVIAGELSKLLTEIYEDTAATGEPRVVVIDWAPDTAALRGLIHAGLGGSEVRAGAVTQIRTAPATTTGALLVLLAETLAHHLDGDLAAAGFVLPVDLDARLAALTLAAPAMLRWSYLMQPPQQDHFTQKINLYEAAERGYVPLRAARSTVARALRQRAELRRVLGLGAEESTNEALTNEGWVTSPGRGIAYIPTGLSVEALRGACRPNGELEVARSSLPWPRHLDCVVVAEGTGEGRGFSLASGIEVSVP